MMRINLLGSLQVLIDNVPINTLRGQRVRSIFAYLVLNTGTTVSRSELAGNLWPDISESQARTNLRRELHALKRTHAAISACITSSKHTVTWHMPADYTYDIEQFGKLCQAFASEQDGAAKSNLGLQAVALYRDSLLPNIADEWLSGKREVLHHQWNVLSENLIGLLQGFNVSEQIINIATRQLVFDPYLETAYLAIMEAYMVSGNSAMALHTYHQCASVLKKDLGITPNECIRKLHARLISNNRIQDKHSGGSNFFSKESSDLIGRSKTLADVTEFIATSLGSLPRVAIIAGESGIGKSRLADEILAADSLSHLIKVRAECHPARIETTFGPFKDWLAHQHFWSACKEASEFDNATIRHIFPQLALYTAGQANKKSRQLRSQEEIFAALSNIVCTASEFYSAGQQAKLLLYIDDMQWADTDFFNWLKYFLINQKTSNVMFLVTVRAEEMDAVNDVSGLISAFSFSRQIVITRLPYLNRSDSCALINNQLASYSNADTAEIEPDDIYDLVQGNPLFLIESVNYLINEGLAQTVNKNSDQRHGHGASPKIYNMLKRRIDLLAENSRHLLMQASVIQRQFSLPLIQTLTQFTDNQLMDALDDLWGRGMLREVDRGDYDFAHDSLREAGYAGLTSPRRCMMHIQVAKALESMSLKQIENSAGEIAAHYEKAGSVQTALDWYLRALIHSGETLAANSAVEYGERCLQLLDTTLPITERADKQLKILLNLSYAHSLKGGSGSKNLLSLSQEIEAVLPYADDPEVRWRAAFRLRLTATFSYQTYRALRLTEFQLSAANDSKSLTNIIEANKSKAFVLYQLGKLPEALRYLDAGLKIALSAESQGELDRHRPSWSLAMLSKLRINVLYMMGRFHDALAANQVGHNHERAVGNPQTRAFVYLWEAKNHLFRGRPVDAEKIGKAMLNTGLEEQLIEVQCLGKFFCDWAEWKKGNIEAAIAALQHTLEMHEAVESNLLLSLWYNTLAEMQYSAQQLDDALHSNSKAIQTVRHTRVFTYKADIYRVRANILAATNCKPSEVVRLYDLSLIVSQKQSAVIYAVKTLVDKLLFLHKNRLPLKNDVRQLAQVVNRAQMPSDFKQLSVAESLLKKFLAT